MKNKNWNKLINLLHYIFRIIIYSMQKYSNIGYRLYLPKVTTI